MAGAICLAASLSCGRDATDGPPLSPIAVLDTEIDDRFALITQFATHGCDVIVYDHGAHKVAFLSRDASPVQFVGVQGNGPGELQHPRAITALSDGSVMLVDWVRRALVHIAREGNPGRSLSPPYELATFGLVGRIAALPGGGFADLWPADPTSIRYVPREELQSRPLIARLDSLGQWTGTGWGAAAMPTQPNTTLLHQFLQWGDVAVRGDTIYMLRAIFGDVQLFSVHNPTRAAARTIALHHYYTQPEPTETAGQPPEADAIPRAEVVGAEFAAAFGVAPNGNVVVVAYDKPPSATDGFRRERLDIYSASGQLVASYPLPTRSTRSAAVLDDGTVVTLANKDADPGADRSVLFFDVPENRQARAQSCGWGASQWGVPTR